MGGRCISDERGAVPHGWQPLSRRGEAPLRDTHAVGARHCRRHREVDMVVDRQHGAAAPSRKGASARQPILRKPDWIRVQAPGSPAIARRSRSCARTSSSPSARRRAAPTSASAGRKKHATMMIMGDICTRACAFCNVRTGLPTRSIPTSPSTSPTPSRSSASATSSSPRSIATTCADGGARAFRRGDPRHPRAQPRAPRSRC